VLEDTGTSYPLRSFLDETRFDIHMDLLEMDSNPQEAQERIVGIVEKSIFASNCKD